MSAIKPLGPAIAAPRPLNPPKLPAPLAGSEAAKEAAEVKRKAGLHKAATEFESIFVRQILTAAKIGGSKAGGYGSMAVDALASGIQAGGGMGLASAIEKALEGAPEKHADKHPAGAPK